MNWVGEGIAKILYIFKHYLQNNDIIMRICHVPYLSLIISSEYRIISGPLYHTTAFVFNEPYVRQLLLDVSKIKRRILWICSNNEDTTSLLLKCY